MKRLQSILPLLMLFLVSACCTTNYAGYVNLVSPKYGTTLLGNNTPNAPGLVDTEKALEIVQRHCAEVFTASDCKEAISKMTVEWWGVMAHTPSTGAVMTIVPDNGDIYAGLTTYDFKVRVAWRGKFYRSAFAHEIIHVVAIVATGDGDALHTNTEWWIDLVGKMKEEMKAQNL